jgi:hypothetical protein
VVFDSSHPRNQFAKQPKRSGDGIHQVAVDWSQAGTAGVHNHILNVGANPAHLNPHQLAAIAAQPSHQMRPAMTAMTQNYGVQQFAPQMQQYAQQPQVSKHTTGRPQMHVQGPMGMQGRGR